MNCTQLKIKLEILTNFFVDIPNSNAWIIPILIFASGLITQYIINRVREIKRLKSVIDLTKLINNDLIKYVQKEKVNNYEFAKSILQQKSFSNKSLNVENGNFENIELIDKKDLFYLLNRRSRKRRNCQEIFIKFFKLCNSMKMHHEYAFKAYNLYVENLIKYKNEWNLLFEKYNILINQIEKDPNYFNFDREDHNFIVENINKYKREAEKENIKITLNYLVLKIIDNKHFVEKHQNNNSTGFVEFWMVLHKIKNTYNSYSFDKNNFFIHYNRTKRKLNKIKNDADNLIIDLNNIRIKNEFGIM